MMGNYPPEQDTLFYANIILEKKARNNHPLCKITGVNPAVWNPPASAGGGMRCNPREVALLVGCLRLLPEGAPLFTSDN